MLFTAQTPRHLPTCAAVEWFDSESTSAMLVERDEYLSLLGLSIFEPRSDEPESSPQYLVDMIGIVDESLEDMMTEMDMEMEPEELADIWADRCDIDFCRDALMREALAGLARDQQALMDLARDSE